MRQMHWSVRMGGGGISGSACTVANPMNGQGKYRVSHFYPFGCLRQQQQQTAAERAPASLDWIGLDWAGLLSVTLGGAQGRGGTQRASGGREGGGAPGLGYGQGGQKLVGGNVASVPVSLLLLLLLLLAPLRQGMESTGNMKRPWQEQAAHRICALDTWALGLYKDLAARPAARFLIKYPSTLFQHLLRASISL
ncbi:hypothetical protein GQ54DRAFT_114579 [Martensiomyces pterosporus]|nr:hypothetical protein GQ54DRAFT_114579 [Martensiomyces pterosporus]